MFSQLRKWIVFAIAACFVVGCGEQNPSDLAISAIKNADKIEIYSLVSGDMIDFRAIHPEEDLYYGNLILGKAEVSESSTREQLIDAFLEGVDDAPDSPFLCFYPRHGLRIINGSEVIDLVICFECSSVDLYLNGGDEPESFFLISDSPLNTFNRVCVDFGLILEIDWIESQKN